MCPNHPCDQNNPPSRISPPEIVQKATAIFSALADPTRFRMLELLLEGERCVHEMAESVGVSQSAASHQLRLLRDRDLVYGRREGQHVYYALADDHVRCLIEDGVAHAEHVRFGGGR